MRRTLLRSIRRAAKEAIDTAGALTSRARTDPDFIIIGAQKAGTTSLYRYLCSHPRIKSARRKEIHYFDWNYGRGRAWYRGHFPWSWGSTVGRGREWLTGEASPYYLHHPLVPGRVAHDLPGAKLIVLLRNPVDRAFSHYQHERVRGHEPLSFEDAIAAEADRLATEFGRLSTDPSYRSRNDERHSYLARGVYADQLTRWWSEIHRDRFIILRTEDLAGDPRATLNRVLGFLGLEAVDRARFPRFLEGRYGAAMEPRTRARLVEYFHPHNERLETLLGTRQDWD
ncbi:MAG: sulfotransferase family protein [Candidatus Limnocylindria bacterium]